MSRADEPLVQRTRRFSQYTSTSFLSETREEQVAIREARHHVRHTFARFLPHDKSAPILDVGCGYGRYVKALQELGYGGVRGIELSQDQVRRAIEHLGLRGVEQADALHWLADKHEAFECILVFDVLEHLSEDDLRDLIRMMGDALRRGGTLIVQVPNGLSPMNPDIYGDITHVRAFTTKSIRQLFRLAGLEPLAYFEGLGPVTTFAGALRRILWAGVVRPMVDVTVRVIHGNIPDRLYSANFIAVAGRPRA